MKDDRKVYVNTEDEIPDRKDAGAGRGGGWGKEGLGSWRNWERLVRLEWSEETGQRDGLRPHHVGLCRPQKEGGFYSKRKGEP